MITSMPEPKRIYPAKLLIIKVGVTEELHYVGRTSTPYLGHYYTYYKDSKGESITVVFFADYTIMTANIFRDETSNN